MSTVIVRYELKPECLDEHLALIDAVFEELASTGVSGVHYGVTRSADGHHFTHVSNPDDDAAAAALGQLASFQAFVANIADRCVVPPQPAEQIVVANHQLLA